VSGFEQQSYVFSAEKTSELVPRLFRATGEKKVDGESCWADKERSELSAQASKLLCSRAGFEKVLPYF
jgi:hypothetical protein